MRRQAATFHLQLNYPNPSFRSDLRKSSIGGFPVVLWLVIVSELRGVLGKGKKGKRKDGVELGRKNTLRTVTY